MIQEILSKYARPVPRYTSYPTAPHFGPEVDARRYGTWLGALGEVGSLSLYLHIPFCRSLCWFCGCSTRVINRYGPIGVYLDTLLKEIALVADALGTRRAVSHIHLGGGTPTMLSARDLSRLAETLCHRFAPGADMAFAVEIDPRVLTAEQAAALGRAGVNRASLGVQDLAPIVQKAINRIQPYETTARAVEALRANGVAEINLDLMYGLPHQTVEGVVATVERALTLAPDRVAVFGYAHVPWMKKHQRLLPEAALPAPEARVAQAAAATAALVERGYVAIGLDHFARADDPLAVALRGGALRRNFQGYTTDRAEVLLGFGASAIGSLGPLGYVQNNPQISAYRAAIGRGELATLRGVALDDDDRLRREIIQQLMCGLEAPIEALCRDYGVDPAALAAERQALQPMIDDGLVVFEGGHLRVTELGRPLVRIVCAAFDRYLAAETARHSVAV
ncbi:MAG: oxygen-independent coproporphyrinogen III oxidase [Alphaproteobacteria bacterium]